MGIGNLLKLTTIALAFSVIALLAVEDIGSLGREFTYAIVIVTFLSTIVVGEYLGKGIPLEMNEMKIDKEYILLTRTNFRENPYQYLVLQDPKNSRIRFYKIPEWSFAKVKTGDTILRTETDIIMKVEK